MDTASALDRRAEISEVLARRKKVAPLTTEELATRERGQELIEGEVEATLDGELIVKKPPVPETHYVPEVRYPIPVMTWD